MKSDFSAQISKFFKRSLKRSWVDCKKLESNLMQDGLTLNADTRVWVRTHIVCGHGTIYIDMGLEMAEVVGVQILEKVAAARKIATTI